MWESEKHTKVPQNSYAKSEEPPSDTWLTLFFQSNWRVRLTNRLLSPVWKMFYILSVLLWMNDYVAWYVHQQLSHLDCEFVQVGE